MRKVKGFKVRDFREKEFFLVDDLYLNGYARHLGASASMVYLSLCRHSGREQRCFPSERLIAEEVGLHERTVLEKIKDLEEWGLIKKDKMRSDKGTWLNNVYYLLDKSEWKPLPCDTGSHGQPGEEKLHMVTRCINSAKPGEEKLHIKGTHKKGTHNNSDEKENVENNVENFVYKSLKWAYGRANGQPDCPKLAFEKSVRRAINEHGLEAVHDKFEYEDNAIQFLYNIKNL